MNGSAWKGMVVVFSLLILGGYGPGKWADQTAAVQADQRPTKAVDVSIPVQLLPEGDIIDKTKEELPPLSGAVVTVVELGLKGKTDSTRKVGFRLPLGQTPGFGENEGVYTFEVTVPDSKFRTVVRRRVTAYEQRFVMEYNSTQDVTIDLVASRSR